MVDIAGGMATCGLRPIASAFAIFLALKATDQIRNSIFYNNLPVILVGGYAGLSDSFEGASHQSITDLVLEPVNRYEINFINSLEQGVELLNLLNEPNFKLMADVFHMNIEDKTIGGELNKYIKYVAYIHLADSNRLAPGQGHTDFENIFSNLKQSNYSGWCSVEILPFPEPVVAARQAVEYLKPILELYNREL